MSSTIPRRSTLRYSETTSDRRTWLSLARDDATLRAQVAESPTAPTLLVDDVYLCRAPYANCSGARQEHADGPRPGVTPGSHPDGLTRTTLQIDGNTAEASLAPMIGALQRVPGVLLAQVDPANARALVAHDAAVPASSLLAAAANVGVRLRVVGDTRSVAAGGDSGSPRNRLANRQLLIAAALAFIALTTVDALLPSTGPKHWILIGLTASLWGFFLARSLLAKR